jgi:hypothetical protein
MKAPPKRRARSTDREFAQRLAELLLSGHERATEIAAQYLRWFALYGNFDGPLRRHQRIAAEMRRHYAQLRRDGMNDKQALEACLTEFAEFDQRTVRKNLRSTREVYG